MKIPLAFFSIFLSNSVFGQTLPQIDSLIKEEMESDEIVAVAVAIIESGKVVHLGAYGSRDLENDLDATIDTPFHIASVSKTVTNLAIFKLVESGSIDLNVDICNYLPFEVRNPYYPDEIITVRDLLNHRSGIKDDIEIYGDFWHIPNGDPTLNLADFLKDYLSEDGELYKKEHYESGSDHKSYFYSNTGFALLGYIIQYVSGLSFERFCQQSIFQPLGMKNTSWFLKHLDKSQVAKTYTHRGDAIELIFKGHNGYPDYPAGQLRTSISDFSKLWETYLNSEKSRFILTSQTTNKITPLPYIAREGFFTWFMSAINNQLYYSHNGGDTGVSSAIIIDIFHKNGIILFANTEINPNPLLRKIEKEMWGK